MPPSSSASTPTAKDRIHERVRIVARPDQAAGARARAGGRARGQARGRGRSHRAVSLGQRRAPEGRQAARHDHPAAVWRPGQELARRRARHRGAVRGLLGHRPHRRRDQHGRDQRGHGLRLGRAEEARGRHGARRRQARHLHHRARGRLRRQRHDHARRQEGQPLRRQRPQALDHRRRRLAPAPDLRQGLRREGQRGRHRRLLRHPRRDGRA